MDRVFLLRQKASQRAIVAIVTHKTGQDHNRMAITAWSLAQNIPT
jgi:hypothetical protein